MGDKMPIIFLSEIGDYLFETYIGIGGLIVSFYRNIWTIV